MTDNAEIARLYKNAVDFETRGDLKRATAELEKAVQFHPADGNVYNRLGDLYIKTGKKSQAIAVYKKGIDVYRDDNYLRNSLALCKKVLKYDPGDTDVYPVMGRLLVSLDAKSDALPYLFEYVDRQKEKHDIDQVIETLDYIKQLGVTDKQLIERMMEAYKSVGRADRADLLAEKDAVVKAPEIKYVFDRPIRVLIIEDDEDDYLIAKDMLKDIKDIRFEPEWARTFSAGLQFICNNPYDVCLLDYHLGERSGLDLLREASENGCVIPVILFTGQSGRETDLEAMYAGAVDYLVKGRVDTICLERSIRYAIERNRLLRALRESQEKLRDQLVKAVAMMDTLNDNQKKLHSQAIHDDLTGLFNRRHIMDVMATAIDTAKKDGTPLCLCIGDIDHFKQINDAHGHQVGDEVLKSFARVISDCLGMKSAVGRYGGDEMCILFPLTTVEDTVNIVETIRSRLAQVDFKSETGEPFAVQACFGIAEYNGTGTQRELFRLADQALYEAKAAGRNRIIVKHLPD